MKNILYTLLLLTTISGEIIHLAYQLSCDHDNIEIAYDFKGENESEESTELGEEASEIPSSHIHLFHLANSRNHLSIDAMNIVDDKHSRISTPPPDFS